jgi:hypothetical protein
MSYSYYLYSLIVPLSWYTIGHVSTENCKHTGFWFGSLVSNKCQHIPLWDSVCEPFIARQFCRIFIFSNAVLNGLKSDNQDEALTLMDTAIYETQQHIIEELQYK